MKRRKVIYQQHHPDYSHPSWTIRLRMYHHSVVTRVQQLNPTLKNILDIASLLEALAFELEQKRYEYSNSIESSRDRVRRKKDGKDSSN